MLAGWAAWVQPWAERVPLLTSGTPPWQVVGCADSVVEGLLVADPMIWPWGFTARRVGSEVQVLDPLGRVKATTGTTYVVSGTTSYQNHQYVIDACLGEAHPA